MDQKPKRRPWGLWVGVGLMVLAAYPLSVGPYVWLHNRDMIPPQLEGGLRSFYDPIDWLCDHKTGFIGDALVWYIDRWHEL